MGKKVLSFIFFYLFLQLTSFAQTLLVTAPDPVYDFGFIRESGGPVSHVFMLENKGVDSVSVTRVTVACTCMDAQLSAEKIAPGKTVRLEIRYNPEGRPGFFNKSVEVHIEHDTTFKNVLFLIRGQVIQKEMLPASSVDRKTWQLVVKPFWGDADGSFDHRFLDDPAFQDFINDITYEIDKEGRAQILLQVFTADKPHKNDWNIVYSACRKRITEEIVRRKYSANQVFFSVEPARLNMDISTVTTNRVKISSLLYNSDFASQSVLISPSQVSVPDYESFFNQLYADSVGILEEYAQPGEINKLLTENSNLHQFIQQAVKYALINKGVVLQILVWLPPSYPATPEVWIRKRHSVISSQLVKCIAEEGIDVSAIEFVVPVIEYDSLNQQIKIRVINPQNRNNFSTGAFLDNTTYFNWLKQKEDSTRAQENELNRALFLPVYYQYYATDTPFDTADVQFAHWLNTVTARLSKGAKIKFLIEASASNSPSSKGLANDYIARKRAKLAEQALIFALRKRGLKGSELVGVQFAYVHGPLYDEKSYLIQFYDKYQYVRIIPYEEKPLVKADFQNVKPYQVTFNTNSFKLPVNSPVFRSFVQRILVLIKKYGYLEINLESSSSTVPTLNFRNNYVLSYQRIQHTRDVLRTELLRNGIDPARLIIRQERALVQGPKYSAYLLQNKTMLERYQYIKIIPSRLVNN